MLTTSSSSSDRSLGDDRVCNYGYKTTTSTMRRSKGGSAAIASKISGKQNNKGDVNTGSHSNSNSTNKVTVKETQSSLRSSQRNSLRGSIHEPQPVSLQTLQPREREMTTQRDRTSMTSSMSGTTAKIGEDSLLQKHQNKILRRTFRDNKLNRRSLITASGSFLVGVPGTTRLSEMSESAADQIL